MTEDQARKKWCPHSMVIIVNPDDTTRRPASGNRIYHFKSEKDNPDEYRGSATKGSDCLASRCMMWRWMKSFGENGEVIYSDVDGYCGLAGQGS